MLRFCIFSDYHYWPTHYPQSADGLERILERAAQAKADFLIHCGDFCHNAKRAPELVRRYVQNELGIPAFSVIGNHEVEDSDSLSEVLEAYGKKKEYESYDVKGYRLLLLDTNYYRDPESADLIHNPPHSHSRPDGDHLPEEQFTWLKEQIESSPYPCLLFSHASLEMPCGCPESAWIRSYLASVNREQPGKVIMCANGHNHRDHLTNEDGIVWFDVNAVYNVEWQPRINPLFPKEFLASARMTGNCCLTKDPLCAIVTVEEDQITIEGMESTYLYDASPEKIGWNDLNRFGRRSKAGISSAVFKKED